MNTQQAFTQRIFCTQKLLHTANSYTQPAFTQRSLYTQQAFTHSKLLHIEEFTQKSFCTQKLLHREALTQRSIYTAELLHREAFTHSQLLHREAFTQRSTQKLLHTEAFTHSKLLHRSFYTEKLLHTEAFTHSKLSHREAQTQRSITQRSFYTEAFTHRSLHTANFYTEKLVHREALSQRSFYTEQASTQRRFYRKLLNWEKLLTNHYHSLDAAITMRFAKTEMQNTIEPRATASEIAAPKPRRQSQKTIQFWSTFFFRNLNRKITSAKIEKICWQVSITHSAAAPCNLDAAITMGFAKTELQNTIEPRAQRQKLQLQNLDAKAKKIQFWSTFFSGIWIGKSPAPKLRKSADKSLSQPWCSHSNTIYDVQLQKTKVSRTQPRLQQPWRSHYNAICKDWVAKHNRTTCNSVRNCSSKTGSRRQSQTRCSPRTRMLTRMLMAQMSKHMDVQSRRTLFWNSLFEQSCTFSSVTIPVHRRLRNMEEGGVLSVECGVWSVKCGV